MNSKLFDLSGRVALVTGGSKGIGKAIAQEFAGAGADLFLCSRKEEHLRAAAKEIADGSGVRRPGQPTAQPPVTRRGRAPTPASIPPGSPR